MIQSTLTYSTESKGMVWFLKVVSPPFNIHLQTCFRFTPCGRRSAIQVCSSMFLPWTWAEIVDSQTRLFPCPSICLSVCLSVCLAIYASVYLSMTVYLSIMFSVCIIQVILCHTYCVMFIFVQISNMFCVCRRQIMQAFTDCTMKQ
jgi:hypothetical protein